jgi:hypothetical protein
MGDFFILHGAMTDWITTLSIMTLSINDIQHRRHWAWRNCHYAECHDFLVVMVNVIMLSVIILSVIMLSVVMLSVVMLNVVAPFYTVCLPHFRATTIRIMPIYILTVTKWLNATHQNESTTILYSKMTLSKPFSVYRTNDTQKNIP